MGAASGGIIGVSGGWVRRGSSSMDMSSPSSSMGGGGGGRGFGQQSVGRVSKEGGRGIDCAGIEWS